MHTNSSKLDFSVKHFCKTFCDLWTMMPHSQTQCPKEETYLLLSPIQHTHGIDVERVFRQSLLSDRSLTDGQSDVHRLETKDKSSDKLNQILIWDLRSWTLTWEGASGKTLSLSLLVSSGPEELDADGFSIFFSTGTHSPYAPSASFFLCWEPEDTGNSLAKTASVRTDGFMEVFWRKRGHMGHSNIKITYNTFNSVIKILD